MLQTWFAISTTVAVVGLTGWAARSLAVLSRVGAGVADAAEAERVVRECGSEWAAAKNLAAAARVVALREPQRAERILALAPEPDEQRCEAAGLVAVVVLERNAEHPADWPNWVVRVSRAGRY